MTIKKITPYQILDSRGEPTLLVMMTSDSGNTADFSVPAGASKGEGEATEKRDGEGAYGGKGVLSCIDIINTVIAPKFIGYPLDQIEDFDGLLIALDGSENKQNFGANTLLALSGAYLKLSAVEKDQPLWQYIAEHNETSPEFPRLFANIVGGGKHAPGLDIQEYMIVPESTSPSVAVSTIYDVYHTVQNIMKNLYGPSAMLVGDEGGLAPIGTSTEVILEAFSQLNGKMDSKFDISLDAAANSFYKDGIYTLENQSLHASDLFKLYQEWDAKFNIFSIEDPFAETDIEGTEILKGMKAQTKPFLVIGDDYTVTNKAKIEQLQQDELFDGIIIKPNQVGTFSETFDAIRAARASKAKVIISHRSGETIDSSIVDLAYGVGAMGIKLGAPVRGERVAKYNRLLEIEADLDANQKKAAGTAQAPVGPTATQKDTPARYSMNIPTPNPVTQASTLPPQATVAPTIPTPPTPTPAPTPTPIVAPAPAVSTAPPTTFQPPNSPLNQDSPAPFAPTPPASAVDQPAPNLSI